MVDKVFKNLKQTLSEFIALQEENYDNIVELIVDSEFDDNISIKEAGNITGLALSIHNYLLRNDNGEEVYPNASKDNKPHIMIEFSYSEDNDAEIIKRLVNSDIYKHFQHTKETIKGYPSINWHYFRCDLGENVDVAVEILREILINIEQTSISQEYKFKAYKKTTFKRNILIPKHSKHIPITKKDEKREFKKLTKKNQWSIYNIKDTITLLV